MADPYMSDSIALRAATGIVNVEICPPLAPRGIVIQPNHVITHEHGADKRFLAPNRTVRVFLTGLNRIETNFTGPTIGRFQVSKWARETIPVVRARVVCWSAHWDFILMQLEDPTPTPVQPLPENPKIPNEMLVVRLGEPGSIANPALKTDIVPGKTASAHFPVIRVPGCALAPGWCGSAVVDTGGNCVGMIVEGGIEPGERDLALISPSPQWTRP